MSQKFIRTIAPNAGLVALSGSLFLIQASVSTGLAQTIPNVVQSAPGILAGGPIDPDMGRLPVIEHLGGYVIAIPEDSGSDSGDHMTVNARSLSGLSDT